jgi:hypothetical protein
VVLLHSANAVTENEAFGGQQNLPDVVIGQDPFGLHRFLRGNDAMQGRLRLHDAGRPAVRQVVFDEMGKLVIHRVELCFVDPHNERG